jgi:hypothetical protein
MKNEEWRMQKERMCRFYLSALCILHSSFFILHRLHLLYTEPMHLTPLAAVAAATLAINLPFGFWRAGVRKFSLPWFLAVHAPVPLIVVLRVAAGLGWRLSTFPVLAGAFFGGQLLGGRVRTALEAPPRP